MSSVIKDVQYDPAKHTLQVTFMSGMTYRYMDVPLDVVESFRAAESQGRFFGTMIRGVYASERVDPADPEGNGDD